MNTVGTFNGANVALTVQTAGSNDIPRKTVDSQVVSPCPSSGMNGSPQLPSSAVHSKHCTAIAPNDFTNNEKKNKCNLCD